MRTQIDVLVLETFVVRKEEQPPYEEKQDWRKEFRLD